MANIPVERTSSTPWWLWLLGLLLLALLIWFLVGLLGDDEEVVEADPIEAIEPAPAVAPVDPAEPVDDDATITSLTALDEALEAGNAGAAVNLTGATVSSLAGDSTFYVGDGTNRALVVLEDLGESEGGPGTGADGAFNVDAGDTVTLRGTVRPFSPGMRGTSSLGDADRAEAEARRYVLVIDGRGELTMN